jgi:tetratricopeptide (TPR) repeat protein
LRGGASGGSSGIFAAESEMTEQTTTRKENTRGGGRRIAGALLLSVGLLAGLIVAWQLQTKIDVQRAGDLVESDTVELRSGSLVKKLSLEYAPLVGAMYWTRAVQYYGEKHRLHERNLDLLWPMLDIATTVDPNMIVAYRFGSIFLSDAPPRGAGRPDLAVKLLERGIAANPDYWRFYQDLGNVYYFDMKDYPKASQAFETGSKFPGAFLWMKVMAAKIAAEGESLDTSYFLWLDVYRTTSDPEIKKNAETHLRQLKPQIDMREIDAASDQFEKNTGKRPGRINDLVQAGLLKVMPADPAGYPYVLGEDAKAELNPRSPLRDEKADKK